MKAACDAPIGEELLIDYWSGDLAGQGGERIEEHLFACGDCAARLEQLASLGTGIATLARTGRVSGIISRTVLNRMQHDGVHVRFYSIVPGETVPCAAFPGDDLVVVSLRADLAGVDAVKLSVMGPGDTSIGQIDEVPISNLGGEVLWATSGTVVRTMPSTRLRLTLASAGASGTVLGEYVLDHSAS